MSRVLALSQSYLPSAIIPWERAITLLYENKVEVVTNSERIIRSPSVEIPVPEIVRFIKGGARRKRAIKFSRDAIYLRDNGTCQYCLHEDHKVLTSELNWVKLSEVNCDDLLLAFDEQPTDNNRRHYKEAIVEKIEKETKPILEVVLENGQIFKVTKEHKFLGKKKRSGAILEWLRADQILGKFLPRLFDVWSNEFSYSAGWLAGIFDGEGWIHNGNGLSLSIGQNPGLILEKIKKELSDRNFRFSSGLVNKGKNNCTRLYIQGGTKENIRLLGQIRPQRLLKKFKEEKINNLGELQSSDYFKVVKVSEVGAGSIIKLTTSTGTLIVDGFPHHNCGNKVSREDFTYDHVQPRALGGQTNWSNVCVSCIPCNQRKGGRTPEQAGMKLIKLPIKPVKLPNNPALAIVYRDGMPRSWADYMAKDYWQEELEK